MLKDLLLFFIPRFQTELNMIYLEDGEFSVAWPLKYYQEGDEYDFQHLAYLKEFTWLGFDYVFHQNIELLDWPENLEDDE